MADSQCEAPLSEATSMARCRSSGRAGLRIEALSKAAFLTALAPPSLAARWPNRCPTSRDLDPLSKLSDTRILPWNFCAH